MSRRKLRDELDADEFADWQAYASVYGLPTARIEAVLATGFAGQLRCWGASVEPKDLIPRCVPEEATFEQMAALLRAYAGQNTT